MPVGLIGAAGPGSQIQNASGAEAATQFEAVWPNVPGQVLGGLLNQSVLPNTPVSSLILATPNGWADDGQGAYRAIILSEPNLVLYCRFDETANLTVWDASGNCSGGPPSGGYFGTVTFGVAGALLDSVDGAITLDGSTGNARINETAVLDQGDGPMSAELWFKRTATLGTFQKLIHKGNTSWGLGFNTSNNIAFDAAGTTHTTSTTTYGNDGLWHHLVATKNGASRFIYVDGVDVTSLGANATAANSATNLNFGRNVGNSEFFSGSIDEAALYSSVLSIQQARTHYIFGRALYPEFIQAYNEDVDQADGLWL